MKHKNIKELQYLLGQSKFTIDALKIAKLSLQTYKLQFLKYRFQFERCISGIKMLSFLLKIEKLAKLPFCDNTYAKLNSLVTSISDLVFLQNKQGNIAFS